MAKLSHLWSNKTGQFHKIEVNNKSDGASYKFDFEQSSKAHSHLENRQANTSTNILRANICLIPKIKS